MRDDQIRRYARHILLPDVGGIGQAQLLAATARIEGDDPASAIAATYLAAGGVGTLALACPALRAALADRNPDSRVTDDAGGSPVAMPARPAWWPAADGDAEALAWWAGGIAATRWMADIVRR
jgi:hypothetical protein